MLAYNAFAFLGCVAAIAVLLRNRPILVPFRHRFLLPLTVFVFSRFAARFLHGIESGSPLHEWSYYFSFGPGSTSQFAGLYASLLFLAAYALARRLRPLALLDALVPAVPIAIAFGRGGCLLAGCCPGRLMAARWTSWSAIPNPYNLPAPLFEAASAVVLFWLLQHHARRRPPLGYLTGFLLLFHGASRFLLQFVRVEEVRWGPLTSTQVLAIPLMLAGAVLLDRSRTAPDRPEIPINELVPARARG